MTSDDLNRLLSKPGYTLVAESKAGVGVRAPQSQAARPTVSPEKPVIRQKTGPQMNKLEAEFYAYLKAERGGTAVLAQSVTLKLGNGVRYTPDFMVMADATNEHSTPVTELTAFETKGFMRDDAAVKLKVAASLYPQIRFHLVTKQNRKAGGGWIIQPVLP